MCGLDAIFCVLSLSLSHSILHPFFWLFYRCSLSLFQSAWPPQTGVTMCGSTFQSVQPVTTPLPTPLVLVTQSQFGYRYETERNRNLMSLFTAKAQYLRLITRDIMSLTRHINPDHPKGCCPYIKCSNFTQCDTFSILNAKSDVLHVWSKILDQWDFTVGWATQGCSWFGHFLRQKKMYLVKIWLHVSVWVRTV